MSLTSDFVSGSLKLQAVYVSLPPLYSLSIYSSLLYHQLPRNHSLSRSSNKVSLITLFPIAF